LFSQRAAFEQLGNQVGTPILGADSLDVSYPTFLEDIKRLGAKVEGE
jgi:5-enolpyruvylshikimate-3-phosphate synthase